MSIISKYTSKIRNAYEYFSKGVWETTDETKRTRAIKVANLSVRSFLDRDLQTRSMSLTYSTVLAIVPAFALLFAIGRGFGFQNLLEDMLYKNFPAQKTVIQFALKFVDSYLKEASQGVFVGIGIVFLLWTLISLLSYIEEAFNNIWDIKHDRTFYQKITDYTSICLMVPVLMICSAGVSIFISATIQDNIHFAFLTPVVNIMLALMPVVLAWLAFTLSFFLIPNTKVEFRYAAISGAVCAFAFQILELLFVNGQIYVAKYNAIYGSFAFLPLLLIWLQLSWLILLCGCVLTYSMQNILSFNFSADVRNLSPSDRLKIAIVIMCVVTKDFSEGKPAPTEREISTDCGIPSRAVGQAVSRLKDAGLVNLVLKDGESTGIAPSMATGKLSLAHVIRSLESVGTNSITPVFIHKYADTISAIDGLLKKSIESLDAVLIKDIDIPQ